LIAIFDADFTPPEDFLLKTIHHFTDPKIGMVQTRWTHINRNYSFLTEWRRSCSMDTLCGTLRTRIERGLLQLQRHAPACGRTRANRRCRCWQHDTLTEDTDFSYRAQLKGWKFVYLQDVSPRRTAGGDEAFKTQQARWAKGLIQTGKKILPRVLNSELPGTQDELVSLDCELELSTMIVLSVLLLPAMIIRFYQGWFQMMYIDLPLFMASTFSISSFYLVFARSFFPRPAAGAALPAVPDGTWNRPDPHQHLAVIEPCRQAECLRADSEIPGWNKQDKIGRTQYRRRLDGFPGSSSDRRLLRHHGVLRAPKRELHYRAFPAAVVVGYWFRGLMSLLEAASPASRSAPRRTPSRSRWCLEPWRGGGFF